MDQAPSWGVGSISSGGSTIVTANYGRFRRRIVTAVVVLVVLLVGGGIGLVALGGDEQGGDPVAVPDARLPDLGPAQPVLAALPGDAPVPDGDVLATRLTPLVTGAALGGGATAQVVDVASGDVLFEREAQAPITPASAAKLLTAVAALTALDPSDTVETTVVSGAAPGEVVLVGGGDPTLSRTVPSATYPGAPTVADLATQVTAAQPAGTPVTRIVVDTSLYSGPLTASGWGPADAPSSYAAPVTAAAVDGARVSPGSTARSGQPGLDAGVALADALGAPGAAVVLGQAPPGARRLAAVQSAPIARLVEQTLSLSDNVLAEALARQVAIARNEPVSFEGAAQAVTDALREEGLDVTDVTLADGSGLSPENVVTAEVLTSIIRGAADGSLGDASALLAGLPVAGYDGTLADRGDDDPATAPGAVRAKTGTLLGVNALVGTAVTAEGRLLAFAVVADGSTGSEAAAEGTLDQFAAQLAACGC